MASRSFQRHESKPIGVRGPFDAYDTRESMHRMVDDFLSRTGLFDYAHYIRIGAFLARRPFGEKQVEYLKKAYREEDAQSENRAPTSGETLDDINEPRNLRREYEYKNLNLEGDRGRWQIFWRQNWRVHALVLCCSLGAAIQGWDESAVNGAQLYYQDKEAFDIKDRPALIGLINSAPYLMCILSCSLAGPLNRYLGRKGTIMFCCVFSFLSCLGQALCRTWPQLLVCRLLLGFGIGPKSATVPIYAAESVPSEEIRGALVMSWQLWTAAGIMLGYAFTYAFKEVKNQWRFMIGSPMVAPAVLFFLMMSLPESPRWHLLKARRLERHNRPKDRLEIEKHYEHAFYALRTLRYTKIQAARDLFYIDSWLRIEQLPEETRNSRETPAGTGVESVSWKVWFQNTLQLRHQPRCRRAMTAGLIVMALQQLCGVNVLAYYSSPVFRDSLPDSAVLNANETLYNGTVNATLVGMGVVNETKVNSDKDNIALGYSFGFGAINFVFAIPAAFLIDKVGRRLLLLTTFPLMCLFQLATGLSFGRGPPPVDKHRHSAIVVFAYLFCAAYSIGEGPVPLVYASECLPLEVRDTGVGILTGIYWGLNSLMALTWPPMYKSWYPLGSFGFYAFLNFIGWFLILLLVPETSRYTLEELHEVFSKDTRKIVETGCAQLKWLITGVGLERGNYGRWVRSEYPCLVPRDAFRDEQELEDRGGLASDGAVTNVAVASQGTGVTPRRPVNSRNGEA